MSRARTEKKTKKRAQSRADGFIPGVPSFQQGGLLGLQTGGTGGAIDINAILGTPGTFGPGQAGLRSALLGQQGAQDPLAALFGVQGAATFQALLDAGVSGRDALAILAGDGDGGGAAGGGGGVSSSTSFNVSELGPINAAVQREQLALQRELGLLSNQIAQQQLKLDGEIRRGELELARQTEARIREMQGKQLRLDAALGKAQTLGSLAASRGDIEQRRAAELQRTLANPRDFAQLQFGLGGGQSFINQALRGQAVGGQSTSAIGGAPTLGQGFANALAQITARPDVPLFEQAAQAAQDIPSFQAGGQLMLNEPVVGVGQVSGRPLFTAGEGGQQEVMTIQPTGQDIASQEAARLAAPPPTSGLDPNSPNFNPGLALIAGLEINPLLEQFGETGQQPGGTSILDIGRRVRDLPQTAGEAISRISAALPPRSFFSLLPSQREFLASVISALGIPPEDFFASQERAFPGQQQFLPTGGF